MTTAKATACVLGAGVLWGCISLFVRALDAAGLSSMEISDVRMVVGTLGMLLVLLVLDPSKLRIRLRDLWLFIGTGVVSVTLFNVCYFTCISLSEASIAVVLLYTCLFQAGGKALRALIMSLSRQGLLFAAVFFLATSVAGYNGFLAAQLIADALSAGLALVLYRRM